MSNFTLGNDGLCTPQIVCTPNCVSCSDENTCTPCSFYLDGTSTPALRVLRIVRIVLMPLKWLFCRIQTLLSLCQTCDNPGTCQACIDGAFLDPDTKNCFICYANCTSCTSPSECTVVCPTGYFLDNNSNCSSCLPHCQFCSDQNTCTSCFKNFDLNGDNTICSETINVTCPQNCTICSDNQTCDICKIDCFLNLCSPCPSNCVSFSDSNTCLSCISNNSYLMELVYLWISPKSCLLK